MAKLRITRTLTIVEVIDVERCYPGSTPAEAKAEVEGLDLDKPGDRLAHKLEALHEAIGFCTVVESVFHASMLDLERGPRAVIDEKVEIIP